MPVKDADVDIIDLSVQTVEAGRGPGVHEVGDSTCTKGDV